MTGPMNKEDITSAYIMARNVENNPFLFAKHLDQPSDDWGRQFIERAPGYILQLVAEVRRLQALVEITSKVSAEFSETIKQLHAQIKELEEKAAALRDGFHLLHLADGECNCEHCKKEKNDGDGSK